MTLQYRLAPEPLGLDEILVLLDAPNALAPKLVRNGFVERMEYGFGHFLTPHDIQRAQDHRTVDLLDRVPGVVLAGANTETYAGRILRLQGPYGPCQPQVYLDGVRVEADKPGDVEALAPLSDLDAVEIYTRRSSVPLQYASGGWGGDSETLDNNPCGVVLFWTKGG